MRTVVVGDKEEELPGWLRENQIAALRQSGFLEGGSVARTGFVRASGRLLVALPKAYAGKRARTRLCQRPSYELHQGLLLIRVLTEAWKAEVGGKYTEAEEPFRAINVSEEAGALPALEAAISLRADFLSNGFYWDKDVQYRRDQFGAPVDWSRTINQHPPVIERGKVFFMRTTHRHRSRDPRDLLHRLHASTVAEIMDFLGDRRGLPSFVALSEAERSQILSDSRSIIRRLLDQTYRDRGRKILKLIGAWLRDRAAQSVAGAGEDLMLLAASNFEYVWERMLRDLISDPSDSVCGVPRGVWTSADGREKPRDGIGPQLDAVQTVEKSGSTTRKEVKGSEVYEATVSYESVAKGWLGEAAFSTEAFGRSVLDQVESLDKKERR